MNTDLIAELRAKAQLLDNNNRPAISGADISHIRHGDGGLDLAKRVVNLQGAADWASDALTRAADALESLEGDEGYPDANTALRDDFIVRKGLWSEFVDSLPAPPPSTSGERERVAANAAIWRDITSAEPDRPLVVSGLTSGVGPGRWIDIGSLDAEGQWHGQYGTLFTPTHWFDYHDLPLPESKPSALSRSAGEDGR